MRDSIHRFFQVGTIHWMSFPRMDRLDALKAIVRDDYFDAIEINAGKLGGYKKEARALLAQSHMKVCYGAQPALLGSGANPNDLNEEGRKKAEEILLKELSEAERFGAQSMAFLSGKWKIKQREEAFSQLLKTTKNLCVAAAERGMGVELEIFDYDVDKAALIGPSSFAARFAAEVRASCPNFGLLVDLSHFPICHETAKDVIRTCRPYITHLHFGNAVADPKAEGYGDLHQRFGYLGSANDVPQLYDYLKVLREEGFFNADNPMVLSMEVAPVEGEDERTVLANTKRCLNRAWAML